MGKQNIGNGAVVGSVVDTTVVLTPAATVTVDCSQGGVFTLVPAQAETLNATNVTNGERVSLVVVTSGITSYVVTFGTNFKTTGTLATGTVSGATFVVNFVAQGGLLTEVSRTVAM